MNISIIVPVYNKIEVFQRCLELNIAHCHQPQEWIVIDNASELPTKNGLLELKEFAEKRGHSFNIITEEKNTGVAIAWNKGLSLAKQEYICVLNNDCTMMPQWDKRLIEASFIHKLDILSPFVIEPGMSSRHQELDDVLNNWEKILEKNKGRVRKGFFGGVVIFGKKEIFNEVGGFDPVFWLSMEDMEFLLRVMRKDYQIGICADIIAFHYISLTRKGVSHNEMANQLHFEQKWGWSFIKHENRLVNGWIKSIQKRTWRWFGLMSTLHLIMPNK